MSTQAEQELARLRAWRAEQEVARAIRAALDAQQEIALARLRSLTAAMPGDPFGEDVWDEQVDHFVAPVVLSTLDRSAESALLRMTAVFVRAGRTIPNVPAPSIAGPALRLLDMVRGMGATAGDRLRREFAGRGGQAGSSRELERFYNEVFGIAGRQAETLARTEVGRAISQANDDSMRPAHDAGLIALREWLSADDARTRPTHNEADGQRVGFDQPFLIGGYYLQVPGDPAGPTQETVNCRCAVLYRTPEELAAEG